eukprot:TRINITY_DN2601_c0_g2_i9.p1 TRINITY_DN2601_c0_g2~~TRINITY_DN2601_c0_g2_i9.p1  ORF type:complete len:338 (-),score=40.62 TRINITY_DN2601_c0_g2_i9:173-1186(-)
MERANPNNDLPSIPINLSLPLKEFKFVASTLKDGLIQAFDNEIPKMSMPDIRIHLNLVWEDYRGVIKDQCSVLPEKILQLNNISDLTIEILTSEISNEDCAVISAILQACKSISTLNFVAYGTTITDLGVQQIVQGLGKLKSLNSITISFSDCKSLGEESFNQLITVTGSLSQLTKLGFAFYDNPNFSDKNALKAGQIITNFTATLTSFVFVVDDTQVTDDALVEIAKQIGALTKLESLHLFLNGLKITDKAISHLTEAISSLMNLSEFSLKASNCKKLKDQSAQCLVDLLQKRTSITGFETSLKKTSISEEAKQKIFDVGSTREFSRFKVAEVGSL